jgi:hypothetical protein
MIPLFYRMVLDLQCEMEEKESKPATPCVDNKKQSKSVKPFQHLVTLCMMTQ